MNNPLPLLTRRFRGEWLALALSLLGVAAIFCQALYRDHQSVEAQEGDRLQVQAKVIDDNLIRQLEGANFALVGVGDDFARSPAGRDEAAASAKLKLLSDAMPGVGGMAILDVNGTAVASSRSELIGKNFQQQEFFTVPARSPDRAVLYVSPPFKTALGTVVIVVGRALMNAKGDFAGIVTAALDPDYFDVVLRSGLYAPDMRTTLIHGDGKVFLSEPPTGLASGADLSKSGSLFSRHQHSGQVSTLVVGKAMATGEDLMVAMRSINRADLQMDRPLVVAVSRELSAVFLPWRTKAVRFGGVFALLALGAGLGLHFSQRRRRTLDRLAADAAKDRHDAAERFELALRGADLGLWDLHVPSDRLVVNARERAMLGYSPDEDLPQGKAWQALIHPDDWPVIHAALEPHLRGATTAYECEHRMRHTDGHWVWIFDRATVVERGADGAPLRIIGTHLDITGRKRSEAELAHAADRVLRSEEQLRQVTDNLPALVSCFDRDMRFRFANRAYRDWLNIEPSSLLGRSLCEVYGEPVYAQIRPHVELALAGTRNVYERQMATPQGLRQVEVTLVPQREGNGPVDGVYVLINDISARHDAELQRARSEERLSLALEGSGLALFDWDIAGDRIYQSAQASALRGEPAVEATLSPAELRSFVHPDDLDMLLARKRDALTGAVSRYHAEFRIRRRSGGWLWLRASGRVVERDSGGRALRLAGTYADINERKLADDRLRRLAEFDTLTDLPNRALFRDRLEQAMVRAARNQPMALLFLDIDHFKTVNDTLGHEAGDQLLKVFARRMRESVRESDTVARLAGDEFTIILEGLRDLSDAQVVAGKLIETLREPIALAGKLFEITTSIGVAMWVAGETDDAALLRRADAALYEAKRRGRNRYFCDESDVRNGNFPTAGRPANAVSH